MPRKPITYETALEMGRTFLAQHGHLPRPSAWGGSALPSLPVIKHMFGQVHTYHQALQGSMHIRVCLKCVREFCPDPADARICGTCKNADEWRESEDWMSGSIVTMSLLRYSSFWHSRE